MTKNGTFCSEIYRSQYDSQPLVIIVKAFAEKLLENKFEALNFVEVHKKNRKTRLARLGYVYYDEKDGKEKLVKSVLSSKQAFQKCNHNHDITSPPT